MPAMQVRAVAPREPNVLLIEPSVVVATRADEDAITSVMTLAFANDPAARRLYPDALPYLKFFPEFVRLYGGPAFDHGGAHCVGSRMGAALWLAPDIHADEAALDALLERTLADTAKPELFQVYLRMKQHHPVEPHWFLPLIGVDPSCHGQGLGTALMQYGLVACDRDGKLAYLDSTKPSNIPFYERFGFELSSWKDRDWSPSASVSDAAAAALTCCPRPVCAAFSESNGSRSFFHRACSSRDTRSRSAACSIFSPASWLRRRAATWRPPAIRSCDERRPSSPRSSTTSRSWLP